ncbi:MAG: hypothetical protein LH472_02105 [Pyrinomonadaceae bacterium]|nr:hypothetical protein [Pyrinomonadaceae bacterium]
MFPTKPKEIDASNVDSFIEILYEIRQERLSGFGIDEHRITNRQYNFLKVLDAEIEKCEVKTRIMTRLLSEQNLLMMRGMMPQ